MARGERGAGAKDRERLGVVSAADEHIGVEYVDVVERCPTGNGKVSTRATRDRSAVDRRGGPETAHRQHVMRAVELQLAPGVVERPAYLDDAAVGVPVAERAERAIAVERDDTIATRD